MNGVPDNWQFGLFDEDWDHFSVLMNSGIHRIPFLEKTEIQTMINGPESFTPDTHYILGEAPELRNYFVAAGFNSSGIASAGGAGRAIAEWIYNGNPTMDLWSVDIRRFGDYAGNINFLAKRTCETLGQHYAINYPRKELISGRPLRMTPLYSKLKEAGASFGSKMGWERANWFAPSGVQPLNQLSFGYQNWFPYVSLEVQNTRENVSIFDITSFSKFFVQGRDAEKVLERICCQRVPMIGKLAYTGMLNSRGGYESDSTVMRLDWDKFLVVTSTAQTVRDLSWLKRNIPSDSECTVTNVSSHWVTLSVMGPKSRDLLQRITDTDLSNEAFPFGSVKHMNFDMATGFAARVTYVGELGWEVYIPFESAVPVYDTLHREGTTFGLKNAGYYAIECMRVEKGYRAWGHDLSPDCTPLEAGLEFTVCWDKDFIGKDALKKQKEVTKVKRRLVQFQFNTSPNAYPIGGEPIFDENQTVVGSLTSAVFSHTLGYSIGMGYVEDPVEIVPGFLKGRNFKILVAGEEFSVKATLLPAFDPKNTKKKKKKKKKVLCVDTTALTNPCPFTSHHSDKAFTSQDF
eukprot:TRINITY_DN7070_c0_g1_i3.p1 TRINITY_DN7070_c0_g1~~TRINITY_DN7070_c0_g1_i3.p1  ORF type:complete len:574 (+),score=120.19 TRINITY_DN7070_c0_g1_i3:793-2514(+)